MTGALFIYPMFKAIIAGNKTQTSRFASARQGLTKQILSANSERPLWKEGQRLYIKEPVYLCGTVGENPPQDQVIYQRADAKFTRAEYAWDNGVPTNNPDVFWTYKQRLFCPEKAARYFIEVEGVERKRLGDFTIEDYQREGLQKHLALPQVEGGTVYPEWRLELANDLVLSDYEPLPLWKYLLKLTDKKFVYDHDRLAWVYRFKLVLK